MLLKGHLNRQIRFKSLPVLFVTLLLCLGNGFLGNSLRNSGLLPLFCGYFVSLMLILVLLVSLNPGGSRGYSTAAQLRVLIKQRLLEFNPAEEVCADCGHLRPGRCKHCYHCKACIQKFDHHCVWLGSCIGRRNLGLYYVFLWMVLGDMLGIAVAGGWDGEWVWTVGSGVVAGLVAGLLYRQTGNFMRNVTTSESYSDTARPSEPCLVSCLDMCCDLQATSHLSRPLL